MWPSASNFSFCASTPPGYFAFNSPFAFKVRQYGVECRSSGLSDFQWCNEHGIKPGTFYNWVKRLRKKSCYDIPPATGRGGYKPSEQQDVVKLEIVDQPVLHEETPQLLSVLPDHTDTNCMEATAEIKLGSALIRISNDIDPALLAQIIRSVGGASC